MWGAVSTPVPTTGCWALPEVTNAEAEITTTARTILTNMIRRAF
jgi:hypothetical protein